MDLIKKKIDGTLLLKYLNETANSAERKQIDSWLSEDVNNSEELIQVAKIYHAQRTRQRIQRRNPYRALHIIQQRIEQRSRRLVIRRLVVAASFLCGVLGVGSLMWKTHQNEMLTQQMITITTNAGMRSHLILPDSTAVFLNAGSKLIYPSKYDKNERRVQLSGEAYFIVTNQNNQPFVVNTANEELNVKVLGTEFNLQAYEKDDLIQITLIEGSVQVEIQGKKGNILMDASDKVTYNHMTDKIFLEKTNTAQAIAWVDGRLIFKDTPMPEVFRQLTHFYSVDFDVQDEVIRNYSFSGIFENKPLFQILEYIKISSKLDYIVSYPENQDVRIPIIRIEREK